MRNCDPRRSMRRVPAGAVLAAVLLSFAAPARAQQAPPEKKSPPPADPCAAAQSQEERNVCWEDLAHRADAQLTALYRAITAAMRRRAGEREGVLKTHETTALVKLRAAERAWDRYRDLQCQADEQQYEGGLISPSIAAVCLKSVTERRTEELKKTYAVYLLPE